MANYGSKLTTADIKIYLPILLYDKLDHAFQIDNEQNELKNEISKHLPHQLECKQTTTSESKSLGIFSKDKMLKDTKIGPYAGDFCDTFDKQSLDDYNKSRVLEFCSINELGKVISYFIPKNEYSNWLQYICNARNSVEQNMEVVQELNQMHYVTIRNILPGEELLIADSRANFVCSTPGFQSITIKEEHGSPIQTFEIYSPEISSTLQQPQIHTAVNSPGAHEELLHGLFLQSEDGPKQKVWICIKCKKNFISNGSLRAHARIHTGEKPYTCQYCHRSFCQMSTLRSHIRLHTGEKPFTCDICNRSFTQSAGLRSHKRTHKQSPRQMGLMIFPHPSEDLHHSPSN